MLELKQARKEARLSQTDMSKLLDIPLRTIQNWEGGVNSPPDYVKKLIIAELKRLGQTKA